MSVVAADGEMAPADAAGHCSERRRRYVRASQDCLALLRKRIAKSPEDFASALANATQHGIMILTLEECCFVLLIPTPEEYVGGGSC